MLIPDLALARRFLAGQALPGRPLVVAVTGAHLYGFPSPDSDLDLKGFHLAPTAELLGLEPREESVDCIAMHEGVECDLTSHEVGKALRLLLAGNGNVLEQIHSPLQLVVGPELEALRAVSSRAVSRRFAAHYRGFFGGVQREHAREPRIKSMLYAYRVALTGINLLRTGEVEGCLVPLARLYGFEGALELVERKATHGEKARLGEAEDVHHRARWPRLEEALRDALATSPLPEEPPNRAEIHEYLVRLRLRELAVAENERPRG